MHRQLQAVLLVVEQHLAFVAPGLEPVDLLLTSVSSGRATVELPLAVPLALSDHRGQAAGATEPCSSGPGLAM